MKERLGSYFETGRVRRRTDGLPRDPGTGSEQSDGHAGTPTSALPPHHRRDSLSSPRSPQPPPELHVAGLRLGSRIPSAPPLPRLLARQHRGAAAFRDRSLGPPHHHRPVSGDRNLPHAALAHPCPIG